MLTVTRIWDQARARPHDSEPAEQFAPLQAWEYSVTDNRTTCRALRVQRTCCHGMKGRAASRHYQTSSRCPATEFCGRVDM
jgi:hypothetical protein